MSRNDIHALLQTCITGGNLYFQPPAGLKMTYPCIVYELAKMPVKHAGNKPYMLRKGYTVTVIDKNPDSSIVDSVAALPLCSFDRHFTSDNLHHNVFTIYD